MKIVKVRFTHRVVAFDDIRVPVVHRFHNTEQGLTMEVRRQGQQIYVYGSLDCAGAFRYAGNASGHWAHSEAEIYNTISIELFKLADELEVAPHHIWPFVEQLPVFTEEGIDLREVEELAGPIKDLLARGAQPFEIINTLHVDKELIEFVLGGELPPPRPAAERDPFEPTVAPNDDDGIW